jgi:TolB-like protein/tetratricopeptide (TPR) repeat protein
VSDGQLGEEDVVVALQRLLAWPDIARSGQLSRFLSYIVERKLRGEAQSIKAYSIAVDVFGRPGDFDPQTDPIVRVQARRLRALLSEFYRTEGSEDELRITLPTGRYVPEFVHRADINVPEAPLPVIPDVVPAQDRVAARRFSTSWLLLAALSVGMTVIALAFSGWGPRVEGGAGRQALIAPPSILVTEFQSLTGDMADLGMVSGLAIELVNDLEQFAMLSVHYGGSASAGNIDYVLSGIVRRLAGELQYSAILTEVSSGNVVWNHAIALDRGDSGRADLLDHVSDRLSMMLGSPRGPLHKRARAFLESNISLAGGESLYLCRVLFDLYRENGSAETGGRALDCFNGLDEVEAGKGQALAAVASLVAEGMTAHSGGSMDSAQRVTQATNLLALASVAAPVSAFVWEQRARLLEANGQHDLAEAAYSTASQINSANSDVIAARARHLAFRGRLERAVGLILPVIENSPGAPAWYFCVPALHALRQGQYGPAAQYAGLYAEADRELGPVLAVMAGQGLGDTDLINSYLPRVLDLSNFRAEGVLTRLRQRISDEVLLRDIRIALLSAGVPAATLNGPF